MLLVLQGGGALGAYHVGVYDALVARGHAVHWTAGVSIGAINAALIASPASGDAVRELVQFWRSIVLPDLLPGLRVRAGGSPETGGPAPSSAIPLAEKYIAWSRAAFLGLPGFFGANLVPPLNPWFRQWLGPAATESIGFYDSAPLRASLDRHVDWARLAQRESRLTVNAASVTRGEIEVFDSFDPTRPLRSDHVLASAALPPAFPAVRIDGDDYWDGGIVSNTPLADLYRACILHDPHGSKGSSDRIVVIDVHLFQRHGRAPKTLDEVLWRMKSIQFGSRKTQVADIVRRHELEMARREREGKENAIRLLEVRQVKYQHEASASDPEFFASAADFSEEAFERLRAQGRHDMDRALAEPRLDDGSKHNRFARLYVNGSLDGKA